MLRVRFHINECWELADVPTWQPAASLDVFAVQSCGFFVPTLTSYRRPPRRRWRCVSLPQCCWPRTCNSQNPTAAPQRWWDRGRPFSRRGLRRWGLLHFSAIPPERRIKRVFTSRSFCRYSAARLRCWLERLCHKTEAEMFRRIERFIGLAPGLSMRLFPEGRI